MHSVKRGQNLVEGQFDMETALRRILVRQLTDYPASIASNEPLHSPISAHRQAT
jgi:hypothetical protein